MSQNLDSQGLREALIECARAMNRRGINVNKSGNVSVRAVSAEGEYGFLITPTGVPYEVLTPEDIVWVPLSDPPSLDGARGARLASSEWEMHARVLLARPEMSAVVHTHSCHATALACQGLAIPAFHYMVAAAGGKSIDVVPYATFGTSRLAEAAAVGLERKNACLLEHHGVLACGASLEKALNLAAEVENLAHQYTVVRSLGEPKLIDDEEMERIAERFKTYGQPQPAIAEGGSHA